MAGLPVLVAAGSGRPGFWRVDKIPGSARLEMGAIQRVAVPSAAESERLRAAAEDLAELLGRRYGGAPSVVEGEARAPKNAVVLELEAGPPYSLRRGEFFVRRQRTQVWIHASDAQGLVNGIYFVAGEILGARWYWPSPLGFALVGEAPEKFPEIRRREEPAFAMRTLHPTENAYARRNRLVRRFQFNHNLGRIFTEEVFERTPEVFAEVNGRRRSPTESSKWDPQPDFTREKTVALAAEAALGHFGENPESRSFSLSINDNVRFDESARTRDAVAPLEYFRDRPNYTDLVFTFTNAVAERVFEDEGAWSTPSGEPRYLTALAYYWTEQSPSMRVHPRVMPVLTSDRAQWHDPAYRAQDKALIRRWADSGAGRIATWDYYFGAPYPYPRQFTRWQAESLRFLSDAGVDVFFSQLPGFWGLDGPKAWLTAELLWDPHQDAGKLLDEFYTEFFGPAATPMRRFYERAEAHRNANAGRAEWIKFYLDEAGIELFSGPILEELRSFLRRAEKLVADDPRRLARVRVVAEAFSLTEAYAAYHEARTRLVRAALRHLADGGGEADAGESQGGRLADAREMATLLGSFWEKRSAFRELRAELVEKPMHARIKSFQRMDQSDPTPLGLAALARSGKKSGADLLRHPGKMDAGSFGKRFGGATDAKMVALLAQWAEGGAVVNSMDRNPGLEHEGEPRRRNFLGPALPRIPGWHFDFRPSRRLRVSASGSEAENGKAEASGVRIEGADMVSFFQDLPVIGDNAYLIALRARYRISPDNRTRFRLTWKDREGDVLRRDLPLQLPRGESEGGRRILLPVRAPNGAYTLRVHATVSRQYEGDFLELTRFDIGLLAPGPMD